MKTGGLSRPLERLTGVLRAELRLGVTGILVGGSYALLAASCASYGGTAHGGYHALNPVSGKSCRIIGNYGRESMWDESRDISLRMVFPGGMLARSFSTSISRCSCWAYASLASMRNVGKSSSRK